MTTTIKNTSFNAYNKPGEQLQNVRNGIWKYSNLVIPGSTAGGIVFGVDPHAAKNMQAVLDPNIDGGGYVLDLANFSKEEQLRAREIAETLVTGATDIEYRRNVAAMSLEILATAQAKIKQKAAQPQPATQETAPVAVTPPAAKVCVIYQFPIMGNIPVNYDSVSIENGAMVVAVAADQADGTFFPSPTLQQPFQLQVNGETRKAHSTPVKYTMNGLTCAVIMVEEPQ